MRVITLNVNGIRSAAQKGLYPWLAQQQADVICLQEIRAMSFQLPPPDPALEGYWSSYFHSDRPGYSGVGLLARRPPDRVVVGLPWKGVHGEARCLRADFGRLSVVSVYIPSGSSGPTRQAFKFDFLARLLPYLVRLRQRRRNLILCGDWNIAHRPIDLKNWKGNLKNSGFLPEERAWMDQLLGEGGFVDAFRVADQRPDQYTWWSNRGRAWANNVGWRIDYQIVTPSLASAVRSAAIYREQRFSDHAPLSMDYDWPF